MEHPLGWTLILRPIAFDRLCSNDQNLRLVPDGTTGAAKNLGTVTVNGAAVNVVGVSTRVI